jgi:hypothetical protein
MSELALTALEMLEPYARDILRECETGGELFERRWKVALNQARAVVAALDDYRATQHGHKFDAEKSSGTENRA